MSTGYCPSCKKEQDRVALCDLCASLRQPRISNGLSEGKPPDIKLYPDEHPLKKDK